MHKEQLQKKNGFEMRVVEFIKVLYMPDEIK